MINERHEVSVEILTYIFEGAFENQYIWELIEDYFLGIIPNDVIKSFEKNLVRNLNCNQFAKYIKGIKISKGARRYDKEKRNYNS